MESANMRRVWMSGIPGTSFTVHVNIHDMNSNGLKWIENAKPLPGCQQVKILFGNLLLKNRTFRRVFSGYPSLQSALKLQPIGTTCSSYIGCWPAAFPSTKLPTLSLPFNISSTLITGLIGSRWGPAHTWKSFNKRSTRNKRRKGSTCLECCVGSS